jgi:dihydrofolate reductase (trimethoprim resistance protein)
MKVSLIVAMDKNRVIGKENDIPWRIPYDWEHVKNTTIGHSIEEVFELSKDEEEIFIFGGEQIYKMFLPYVDKNSS